jgi:small subunit ribosomal protein S15
MTKKEDEWIQYDRDEIEKLIIKLAKERKSGAEIGMILRDQYGVPKTRSLGVRISKVLDKHDKKEIPEDMFSLLKQAVSVHSHLARNKHDSNAKHGMEKIESKVRRLAKYYIRKGRLAKNWKYSIEKAKLLVK